MENQSGIYLITCTVNGKKYVGSSVNIKWRWKSHRVCLKKGNHSNPYLQNSYNKYGSDKFIFSILELCEKDKTIEREQFWMDTLKPEFNIAKFASASGKGLVHNEASRKKSSESNKKYWEFISDETREERRRLASHPTSEETKKILSEKTKLAYAEGRLSRDRNRHTDETKDKLSQAAKNQYANHNEEKERKRAEWELGREQRELDRREKIRIANIGRKVSEETKEKLRQVALVQQQDPAYRKKHHESLLRVMGDPAMREKLSNGGKGKIISAEHRRNIGNAHRGMKRSAETRKNLSLARKRWWAKRKKSK